MKKWFKIWWIKNRIQHYEMESDFWGCWMFFGGEALRLLAIADIYRKKLEKING